MLDSLNLLPCSSARLDAFGLSRDSTLPCVQRQIMFAPCVLKWYNPPRCWAASQRTQIPGGWVLLEAFEHEVVRVLQDLLPTIGWAGIVIVMALESANIPIPSEVTMPLAGWMLGLDKNLTAIETVLLAGFMGALGCTLGSIGSYALGAYGGRPFLEKYGRYIMVNQHDDDRPVQGLRHAENLLPVRAKVPTAPRQCSAPNERTDKR